ncbi:hypothetical protein Vadar_026667 [Vaccinium darrowii]|uniref:Uncharacterized protein n=1 Tax=Vaccinium darrowii TaxID=229202 RepID=A0ACB7YQG0_9ERIC|nr:hypothetical protein Vadar_026667 [Vaccinium darrowii]
MAPSFLSDLIKRQRTEADNYQEDVILNVEIKYADGLDPDNMGPNAEMRTYQVIGWTETGAEFATPVVEGLPTGAEFATRVVEGLPDPQWRRIFSMRLRRNTRYLYLEVFRTGSKFEGTSKRRVSVGRTRVLLPTVANKTKGGRLGLVRSKGLGIVAEGHIQVAVEITKRERYW